MSSEHSDKLKEALAENGSFDAAKAARDLSEANAFFDSRLRKGARYTWLFLIIVIAVLEFAFVGFVLAFSTKAIVGFAVLLVITVVLITSTKYEITNTKISLLREMKLLRLERLGLPTDEAITPSREAARVSTSPLRVLSRRENVAWFVTLILVALVSNQLTFRFMNWGTTTTNETRITLLADGSGTKTTKASYRHIGLLPMTSASLWTGGAYTITQWLDGKGRDLPIGVSTVGPNRRNTVQFIEPVMPGDEVRYTTTTAGPNMATKEGDTWTYRGGAKRGGQGRTYTLQTVVLPQGAEIVSVQPKPAEQSIRDGRVTVRFQALVEEGHELSYTIQYRLPNEKGTQRVPK